MSRLIYIETSIPSFYFETRHQPINQARRQWTCEWWDFARWQDELVTSLAVLDELDHTPEPKRSEMLALMEPLPLLESAPAIEDMVTYYLQHMIMPADADGDARHLALATFHKCDILLTWNCRHLANANKSDHIRAVNQHLGYDTPIITTPLELLGIEP